MADISLTYLDQPLNNISIAYHNDAFYAERLFPIVPVNKQSGRYWVYAREKFRWYETLRFNKAESREIAAWTLSNNPFFCNDHSLKDGISDEDRSNNSLGADLEVNTVENLTDAILLDLELRAQTLVAANVPNVALSGPTQWSDYVNSDPIAAIEAQRVVIKQATVKQPNTLAVSYPVHVVLRQHPRIIDRFKYTQVGILREEHLASVFEVDNYWVMGAEYDIADEGQNPNLQFVWGKNALLACIESEPKLRDITLGYCFRWLFGAPELGGTLTKRYRVEQKTLDVIEVHRYDDLQSVVPASGVYFTNAVA
jgi:hypothetical protein